METEYYVYVYLDPRKKGKVIYGDYGFEYEPFYVGKGKEYRHKRHLNESQLNDGSHKSNIIKKLLRIGEYPNISIIKNLLSEKEAFALEIELIKTIGRNDKHAGPLTNKTDGGEGISGYRWTDEQKESIKDRKSSRLGATTTEEHKRKIGEANKDKKWSDDVDRVKEWSKLKSKQCKGKNNPFFGKHHTEKSLNKIRKKVIMYDVDMKIVGRYGSATECAEKTGFPISKISSVANGTLNHYKKFKFKYK